MSNTVPGESWHVLEMPALQPGARLHIIGIGGSGMSAVARVVLEGQRYRVSGSDRNLSEVGRGLVDLGAKVYEGHRPEQVRGADVVVISSAVPPDNVEVQEARALGIPVVKRPQFLSWLTAGHRVIAVAGTHGKTTTTAMIVSLLVEAGLDPSFIVGGVVAALGCNAHAGKGPHFVIEADEYDRTFHALRPALAVVTNVEMDHPDCYATYADVQAAFATFAAQIHEGGCLIACNDDAGARALMAGLGPGRRVVRYGLAEGADVRALSPDGVDAGQALQWTVNGMPRGMLQLRVPGHHNIRNALAALSVSNELGIDDALALRTLREYRGVARRFELKGEVAGITVIDDYAHHPTKIRATLAAARSRYGDRTLWAVFQPHTFSRTRALLDDYRQSFTDADHVLITPIYAARERDDGSVSSADLVRGSSHPDMRLAPDLDAAAATLVREMRAGDVLLVMGAGDSDRVGASVLSALWERAT
ncbi:MAG: UDP-N-acetylmuramate--L-alanine ligase [Anaerolineae bacterium]